ISTQIMPKENILRPPREKNLPESALQTLGELLGPLLVGGCRIRLDFAADRGGHLEIPLHGTEPGGVEGVPSLAHHDGLQVLEPLENGLVGLPKTCDLALQVVRGSAKLALGGLEGQPTAKSLGGDRRDGDQDPDPGDGHGWHPFDLWYGDIPGRAAGSASLEIVR